MANDEVDQELSDHAEGVYSRYTLQKEELYQQALAGLTVKDLLTIAATKAAEVNEDAEVDLTHTYVRVGALKGMVDISFRVTRS